MSAAEVEVGMGVAPHRDSTAIASSTTPDAITGMLNLAIERGVSVEALEKLVALHERVSDRAAAQEFAEALAAFQAECPPIGKTSKAKIVTRGGGSYEYSFAALDTIANAIRPLLRKHGLSYGWDSAIRDRLLHTTCRLRHVNGHQETATFSCPTESSSAMSEQQKHAAALTFARRQSLIQVLGLTTAEPDTDAANPEPITKEQAAELRDSLQDLEANEARFLEYMEVEAFEDIRASDWLKALNAIRTRRETREQQKRRTQ